MSAPDQPAAEPSPELVAQLAEEMIRCRRRGLGGIDKDTPKQPRVKAPQLERLAGQYCRAKGLEFHGRTAPVSRLLREGLDAYRQRGCDSDGAFLAELFFGDDTPGTQVKNAGQLLDEALARRSRSEQWFNDKRQPLFKGFAGFLVTFVTETASTSTPQAAPDITPAVAPHTAPDTTPAPARRRPSAARITLRVILATVLLTAAGGAVLWFTTQGSKSNPPLAPHRAFPHRLIGLPADAGKTYTETVASRIGAATFTDPYSVDEQGPKIPFLQQVQVPCKVYSPVMPSIGPQAYWYRITSPPWNNHYYAPANSFLNGDPPHGPYTGKDIDPTIPDCPVKP